MKQEIVPEHELLIACVQPRSEGWKCRRIAEIVQGDYIDWDTFVEAAERQRVGPRVWYAMRSAIKEGLTIPGAIASHLERCYYQNIALKSFRFHRLEELLAYFAKKEIRLMLIKGAAMDLVVYDQPWCEEAGDIDVVLGIRRDHVSADFSAEITDRFGASGFEYDFYEHHDVTMNGVLPVNFAEIWNDAILVNFRAEPVWVMSLEDMLIAACVNSCRKRYVDLKALLQIAEILSKRRNLSPTKVIQKSQSYGCEGIVYAGLLVTEGILGRELDRRVTEGIEMNLIRRMLIRYSAKRTARGLFEATRGIISSGPRLDYQLVLPYLTYRSEQIGQKLIRLIGLVSRESPGRRMIEGKEGDDWN